MIINFFGDFCVNAATSILFHEDLKSMLNSASLNVVNFEGSVKVEGAKAIGKVGPCLSNEKEAPSFLEEIGFHVITMANNHAMDFGGDSLKLTKGLFENSMVVGAGTWVEAYQVKTINVGGKILGFLGLTHNEFGVLSGEPDDSNK